MAKVHITADALQVKRLTHFLNLHHDVKLTEVRVETALKQLALEESDGSNASGCSACAGGCSLVNSADIGDSYEDYAAR